MKQRGIMMAFLLCISITGIAQDTTQQIVAGRKNSPEQEKKPYVIVISADGFRYDYAERYQAENIQRLSNSGVRAASMIPSFPSLTIPNHYTLATGLYPAHHGIVNNYFYDRKKDARFAVNDTNSVRDGSWYGGVPLWVLAEQQQMLSACFYWAGSEAPVQGMLPTYRYNYNNKIPMDRRIQAVKDWLTLPDSVRPHLIMFYIVEPDYSGHMYGPESPQTGAAVKMVDSAMAKLTAVVAETGLPVNFVFLSDHGMSAVDHQHPLTLPADIDPEKLIIPASGTMLTVYPKDTADITSTYEIFKKNELHYKTYLSSDMPSHLHFNDKEDRMHRIADILLIAELPYVFSFGKTNAGYHGYDPAGVKDMHAFFSAWGPGFKRGRRIGTFESVHVYPMVAELLKLRISEPVDGKRKVLRRILR